MKDSVLHRVYRFYYDGFRGMTVGRTLWLIIGLKIFFFLFIIFVFFMINNK
ncbi:MAG: DUF4492 domain-containing protein [Prevotellaceae bacterium]|nr:DUF4492 domain-containing protein [Prevotellaceae bacterium]